MTDPFFVVCGYGQSGRRLVAALDEIGYATVVLETDPDRARAHLVLDTRQPSALLIADARAPDVLEAAGVRMPNCAGLVALTSGDEINQSIAIGARVLAPDLPVLERVKSPGARESLEAVGGVIVVSPFETLAANFGMALAQPEAQRLEDWLSGVPGAKPPPCVKAPRGHWVIAGYGRLGHRVAATLQNAGLALQGNRHRFGTVRRGRHLGFGAGRRGAAQGRHRGCLWSRRRHRCRRQQSGDRQQCTPAEAQAVRGDPPVPGRQPQPDRGGPCRHGIRAVGPDDQRVRAAADDAVAVPFPDAGTQAERRLGRRCRRTAARYGR